MYENCFPDLSRDDADNRRLPLQNSGLYLNFYNHVPDGECKTNIISSTSFEISCNPASER